MSCLSNNVSNIDCIFFFFNVWFQGTKLLYLSAKLKFYSSSGYFPWGLITFYVRWNSKDPFTEGGEVAGCFFYLLEKVRTLSNTYGRINENSEQARRKMFSFFFLNGVYGCHHSVNCSLGPPACIVLPPLTNFVDQNYLFRLFHFSHQFFLVRKCQ